MFKLLSPLAIAGALLSLPCLGAGPALALSPVTFVSGKGTDTGTCASPANPCRSFQFAIGQTSAGGEVKALDPAHYGGVVIGKSISITGIEGASINRVSGAAIGIFAGPNDAINLSHLILDGSGITDRGIELDSGGSLTITHCVVRNFKFDGIALEPTDRTRFLIADTVVSDNQGDGILVRPGPNASAVGTLEHVSMNKNGNDGMLVDGSRTTGASDVTSVDSRATNNSNIGFAAVSNGFLRLARSAAIGNGSSGVFVDFGKGESAGDNFLRGNRGANVTGNLNLVGTR